MKQRPWQLEGLQRAQQRPTGATIPKRRHGQAGTEIFASHGHVLENSYCLHGQEPAPGRSVPESKTTTLPMPVPGSDHVLRASPVSFHALGHEMKLDPLHEKQRSPGFGTGSLLRPTLVPAELPKMPFPTRWKERG